MKAAYKIFKENREYIDELDAVDPEIIPLVFGLYDSLEVEQLMALIAIVKDDAFMENPLLFEDMILILNGISPSPLSLEGCTANQLWYGLYLMSKLRPDLELGELVKGYIDFVCEGEGFYIYPKSAKMESPVAEMMPEILDGMNKKVMGDFVFADRQSSKLIEVEDFIQNKIKLDETWQ